MNRYVLSVTLLVLIAAASVAAFLDNVVNPSSTIANILGEKSNIALTATGQDTEEIIGNITMVLTPSSGDSTDDSAATSDSRVVDASSNIANILGEKIYLAMTGTGEDVEQIIGNLTTIVKPSDASSDSSADVSASTDATA